MYSDRKRIYKNGYIVVEYPEHPKAFDTGAGIIGVYEHVFVAEQTILDRPIKAGEVIHHMDSVRDNNSPDNLMVLTQSSHAKLHRWLDKNVIIAKPDYQERKELGCIRCPICEMPVSANKVFCDDHSDDVTVKYEKLKRYDHPSKEELTKMIWEKPTSQLAKDFNVSDKAIEKLCKKLEVDKPPRGYWTKKKAVLL